MPGDALPLRYRLLLRTYPWRRLEPVPSAIPARPLAESTVALVSTAGLVPAGAPPFDLRRRGGDPTFRVIPGDARAADLTVHHRSDAFDRRALAGDLDVAYPVGSLARLAARGEIGGVAARHVSFMGSITAPGRLVREEAPRVAELFRADGVDIVLLVPV